MLKKTVLGKNFFRASVLGLTVLAAGCSTTSGLDPKCCMSTEHSTLVFGLFGSQTRSSFDRKCALTQAANTMLGSDDPYIQVSGYNLIKGLYNTDKELSEADLDVAIKENINKQSIKIEGTQTFRCETEITNGKKEILLDTCKPTLRPPAPIPLIHAP